MAHCLLVESFAYAHVRRSTQGLEREVAADRAVCCRDITMAYDATVEKVEHNAPPPSFALLLQSCSSITEKALACRTLASKQPEGDGIRREMELADWLDRHILDYRAVRVVSTPASALQNPRQLRVQQQELLDESVRRQQEHLLLSRIEMSSIANESLQSHNLRQQSERGLREEAIQSRDEQVQISLEKIDQLHHVSSQLYDATKESQKLQTQNRSLWQQISADKTGVEAETSLATENRILKRVLQDILVGSDLDWYADERLRDTMLKLET